MADFIFLAPATVIRKISADSPEQAIGFYRRWLRRTGTTAALRHSATVTISAGLPRILGPDGLPLSIPGRTLPLPRPQQTTTTPTPDPDR